MLMCSVKTDAGSFEWAKNVSHALRGYYATSIKSDNNNNVVIGGSGNFCLACPASFISKYDSIGNETFYKGLSDYSSVNSVGLDYIGNVYLSATFTNNNAKVGLDTFSYNANNTWSAIIKLNPQGNLVWWKPWPGSFSINIAVDSIGNVFATNGDTLRRFNSNGVLNWTVPVNGDLLDVERNYLVVSSSTLIQRLSKSTGSINGSTNVVDCKDVALDNNGDIYFTGINGLGKLVNLNLAWNNPQIIGDKIDVRNNSIWTFKNFNLLTDSIDSVATFRVSPSGIILLSDTIFNSRMEFISIDGSNKVFFVGDLRVESSFAFWKPLFVYKNIFTTSSGFILGRYNAQPEIKLGFDSVFWNPNDPWIGNWLGYKRCPGTSFNVSYRLHDGVFLAGNVVFVELSDELGSFSNPLVIGAGGGSSLTNTVTCQLPSNFVNGYGYKIRLRSTSPSLFSVQTTTDLYIDAPNSTISLSTNNLTFCSKTETLTVNSGWFPQWQLNGVNISAATNYDFKPSASGIYRCLVSDDNCYRLSTNQIAVTVKALPNAAISPSSSTEICIGDSVAVSVPLNPNYSYQWYKSTSLLSGQTSNQYMAKAAGNYKVVVTGSNGCTKTSLASKISVYRPKINAFGPTSFCLGGSVVLGASNGSSTAWQWRKNNIDIANETNQFFVANSAGDYKVLTTSNGGCTSLSSKVSVVVNCREGDFAKSEFEIFPNPSNDFIYITGSIIEKSGVISIYDLAGRMVKSYISIGSNNNLEVEISSLEDGLYVISYESGNSEKAFSRFIKED